MSNKHDAAMRFIRINKFKMSKQDLTKLVSDKFDYSYSYAQDLVRTGGCSLKELLDHEDEVKQKKYEQKLRTEIESRPKLIILY